MSEGDYSMEAYDLAGHFSRNLDRGHVLESSDTASEYVRSASGFGRRVDSVVTTLRVKAWFWPATSTAKEAMKTPDLLHEVGYMLARRWVAERGYYPANYDWSLKVRVEDGQMIVEGEGVR